MIWFYTFAEPIVSDFIDGLKYETEVEEEVKSILKTKKDFIIPVSRYYTKTYRKPKKNDEKIALIYASGTIDGGSNPSSINLEVYQIFL